MDERSQILEKFSGLTVLKQAGIRAPHKPFLVLTAIAEIIRSGKQFISYSETAKKLRALHDDFGRPGAEMRAYLPFWRLRNDGIRAAAMAHA